MSSHKKLIHAFLVAAAALLALVLLPAEAQERSRLRIDHSDVNNIYKTGQVGVGIQVGANTGIVADYWTSESTTLNLNLTALNGNFGVGAAHDWMFRDAFGSGEVARTFVPFVGVGALGVFGAESDSFRRNEQNFALAAQMPIGVEYLPSRQRFSIYAQVLPSVELTPYGYFFINGDIGGKFYF
jgi:hypothetical protein